MRPVWQSAIFLLVVVFISLIYKFPANIAYQYFPKNSPVHLSGISGSIWSGHAEQIAFQSLVLKKFDWQLSALGIILGELSVEWSLDDTAAKLQGELSVTSEKVLLKNTTGHIELVSIAQRLPPQDLVLGGKMSLDVAQLEITQEKISNAVGTINWQRAEFFSPENIVLGEFNADLGHEAGRLLMKIKDKDAAVAVKGNIQISVNGRFDYFIQAAVRDTSAPGLLEAFNQLGQTDENGSITLQGSSGALLFN